MRYEWDEAKRRSNIAKHGLDFADVETVFGGPVLKIPDGREYGEDRWLALGMLKFKVVAVIYTEPDEETIRVISFRKAAKHEQQQYEAALRN